jgi:hypothetical protein
MKLSAYVKTVVAAAAAGAVAVNAAVTDSVVTNGEWVTIGLAVLGALGVYAAPNASKARHVSNDRTERPYRSM